MFSDESRLSGEPIKMDVVNIRPWISFVRERRKTRGMWKSSGRKEEGELTDVAFLIWEECSEWCHLDNLCTDIMIRAHSSSISMSSDQWASLLCRLASSRRCVALLDSSLGRERRKILVLDERVRTAVRSFDCWYSDRNAHVGQRSM